MADGFLGNLLGGAKSIGTGLLNIPKQIGTQYEAGNLFGGGGALGQLLGPEARQEAQRQAIMKLGLGLLGQGPSRTPISFGQSLASGLLGAQEGYRKDLQSQLAEIGSIAEIKKLSDETGDLYNVYDVDTGLLSQTGPKQVEEGSNLFREIRNDPTKIILKAGTTSAAGIPVEKELGVSGKAITDKKNELIDAATATGELISLGNKLLEGYDKNADAATVLGTVSSIGQKIYEDASALGRAAGIDVTKSYEKDGVKYGFNESHFDSIFKENDINSSVMKSQVLDLAYLAAKARGQEGRGLSDRDIKIFSQIIGGTGSVESKKARLKDYLERTKDLFQTKQSIIIQQYPDINPISLDLNVYSPEPNGQSGDSSDNDRVNYYLDQVE